MIEEWLYLLALIAAVGLWLAALRARELALQAARNLCSAHSVQLLDETVGLAGLRPRRHHGRLRLALRYSFEVSLDGSDRHRGDLWMLDGRVVAASTPWQQALEPVSPPMPAAWRASRRDGE